MTEHKRREVKVGDWIRFKGVYGNGGEACGEGKVAWVGSGVGQLSQEGFVGDTRLFWIDPKAPGFSDWSLEFLDEEPPPFGPDLRLDSETGEWVKVTRESHDDTIFVTSDSGGRKGAKLPRFHDIPGDSLWELAEHYGKGAEKYPDTPDEDGGLPYANWRRGYDWSLCYSAAYRHLTQALGGEDIDPETGSKHLIAVAWHCMTLAHWLNDPDMHKYDDRPAVLEKRGKSNG